MKNRGVWHAAICGVTKSWTRLSDWTTTKYSAFPWKGGDAESNISVLHWVWAVLQLELDSSHPWLHRPGGQGQDCPFSKPCMCLVAQSCPTLCNPLDYSLPGSCPWEFSDKNTKVGCHFLLQGIFLIQGSKLHLLCLLHCSLILYPLSHWGSPFSKV